MLFYTNERHLIAVIALPKIVLLNIVLCVYTVAGAATTTCYEIKEIKHPVATQYMSARPFKPPANN